MKRAAVYSSSRGRRVEPEEVPEVPRKKTISWRERLQPHRRELRAGGIALAAAALLVAAWTVGTEFRGVSPAEVEAAIQRALEANPPKPTAADAFEKILPSLVHVRAFMTEEDPPKEAKEEKKEEKPASAEAAADPAAAKPLEGNIGTGVVIVEDRKSVV